jgi:hypothetical protein
MPAEIWFGRKPRPAFLEQALVELCDVLSPCSEHFLLLSQVRLVANHDEIDLIVLKRAGIFLIELLHAWDPIEGGREGDWLVTKPDGARLAFNARRLNPFRQLQTHYVDWRDWLIARRAAGQLQAAGSAPIDFTDILSYVVVYPAVPAGSRIAIGRHAIQVAGWPTLLNALKLRTSPHLDWPLRTLNQIPRLLGLELAVGLPLAGGPRRITQKLEPDYQPPRTPTLVALGHDFSIPVIRLRSAQPLCVGRDDDNDVIIHHPAVSRHHARLWPQADDWLVQDLGSDNGTFISPTGAVTDESLVSETPGVLINRAVVRFGPAAYIVSL